MMRDLLSILIYEREKYHVRWHHDTWSGMAYAHVSFVMLFLESFVPLVVRYSDLASRERVRPLL